MTIKRTMVAAAMVIGAAAMTGCSGAGEVLDEGVQAAENAPSEPGGAVSAAGNAYRHGWHAGRDRRDHRDHRDHRHDARRDHRRHNEHPSWWRRASHWW